VLTLLVEIITVMFIAVSYPILSFQGTPLIRRLSLLTLIIFGEGVTVACSNITQVIDAEGNGAWSKVPPLCEHFLH
jgi:low temperature requirement protein LtrA